MIFRGFNFYVLAIRDDLIQGHSVNYHAQVSISKTTQTIYIGSVFTVGLCGTGLSISPRRLDELWQPLRAQTTCMFSINPGNPYTLTSY